jgi:hypothetical protein
MGCLAEKSANDILPVIGLMISSGHARQSGLHPAAAPDAENLEAANDIVEVCSGRVPF